MKNSWKHCTYDLQLWVRRSICSSETISRHDINREAAGRIARSDSWKGCQECGIFIFGWLELELFLVGCFRHLHSSLAENGPSCLVPVGRVDASFEHWSITERVSKTHAAAAPSLYCTLKSPGPLCLIQVLIFSRCNILPRITWEENLAPKNSQLPRGPDHRCDFFERCHSIVSQGEATR